jgi:hypothetical protein
MLTTIPSTDVYYEVFGIAYNKGMYRLFIFVFSFFSFFTNKRKKEKGVK